MINIKENKYIKSPLNYVGGKYKLLPQILPLFPNYIDKFVDLFGGGFNVGINVKANKIYYNDINKNVVNMLEYFKINPISCMLKEMDNLIEKYDLSKINQQGYLDLRNYYNKENKSPIILYTLMCYAFNNQIRFNSKNEYNMPFGKDRSSFNPTLRDKFIAFVSALQEKDCKFYDKDFNALKMDGLNSDDLIYCDPPYLDTVATYNENGGWGEEQENLLRELLILINNKNIKFALSNNVSTNPSLKNWAEGNKFKIHYLNHTYGNCNYQKKDKSVQDLEVLITNY